MAVAAPRKSTVEKAVQKALDALENDNVANAIKELKKLVEPKPQRKPNAYHIFMKEKIAELKKGSNDSTRELMGKASKMWKDLSDKEKQKFKDMAAEVKSDEDDEVVEPPKKATKAAPPAPKKAAGKPKKAPEPEPKSDSESDSESDEDDE
jgi:hypothetical protein